MNENLLGWLIFFGMVAAVETIRWVRSVNRRLRKLEEEAAQDRARIVMLEARSRFVEEDLGLEFRQEGGIMTMRRLAYEGDDDDDVNLGQRPVRKDDDSGLSGDSWKKLAEGE